MSNQLFKLKHFDVAHDRSTMKVGTDAMILGAVAVHDQPKFILDIGTGCGILALMMAQKYPNSKIYAIDIDEESTDQALANFMRSNFRNLSSIRISLQDFARETAQKFDLIVSNPPFFQDDLKSDSEKKNLARHNDNLSFEELISDAKNLLSDSGVFWFILPARYDSIIQNITDQNQMFIQSLIELTNDHQENPVRIIYAISKKEQSIQKKKMNIRIGGKYSSEYIELTKDFHDRDLS
ncbi:MAG: methyltransferase [Crocinitomicaceae bacterium]|nr:methyltransferase [Crocinitomicaceae bacterium]